MNCCNLKHGENIMAHTGSGSENFRHDKSWPRQLPDWTTDLQISALHRSHSNCFFSEKIHTRHILLYNFLEHSKEALPPSKRNDKSWQICTRFLPQFSKQGSIWRDYNAFYSHADAFWGHIFLLSAIQSRTISFYQEMVLLKSHKMVGLIKYPHIQPRWDSDLLRGFSKTPGFANRAFCGVFGWSSLILDQAAVN